MQKRFLISWLTFWLTSAAVFIYVLGPLGISHMYNSELTVLYFLMTGIGGGFLFGGERLIKYLQGTVKQIKWIVLSFVIFFILMEIIKNTTKLDHETELKLMTMKIYFPLLKVNLGFTKLADIFFQQTLILSLLLYLKSKYEAKADVIKVFTIVFFFLHVPLIFVFGWMSMMFTIPSLFGGILFALFILGKNYGLVYTFLLHEFFYLALAFVVRLL